jgi:DtxR family Mn-dependent transcriptional regulator
VTKKVTKSIEDYLKTIYGLTKKRGVTTITEISSALHIRPPSVTEMIQKMERRGFVSHEKYKGITLTKKGKNLAKDVQLRNKTVFNFLRIIGVGKETAKKDACRMEHDLDSTTMEYLTKFVEFVQSSPQDPRWLDHFKYYRKTGTHKICEKEMIQ